MKIAKDSVVRFHYSVSEPGQESLESSRDREPLAILIGHGNKMCIRDRYQQHAFRHRRTRT